MVKARLSIVWLLVLTTACSGGAGGPSTTVGQPASVTSTTTPPTSSPTLADRTMTSRTARRPLIGRMIVIDPGHNGMNRAHPEEISRLVEIGNGTKACNTTGTSTADGYTESELNWAIAQLVVTRLESAGAAVVLTRQDNEGWGPCIDERAGIGNRNHADAVISIHADGGPDDGRGFHVIQPADIDGLTDDIYDESSRLARDLHDAFLATGMPVADYIGADGYSKRTDIGGLNLSDVPAVFLETGNMRNQTDAILLTDPDFQNAAADAITVALVRFLVG